MKPLRIFVLHASDLPTDFMPHGDGLLAYRYIAELAKRGHELVVAVENSALNQAPPPSVKLVQIEADTRTDRVGYMRKVRALFESEHAERPFDLVHQLNPVFCGLSLALTGKRIPILLGPYVTSWPNNGERRLARMMIRTLRFLEQRQAKHIILAGVQAESNRAYPGVKQTIIPYGIDTDVFTPQPPTKAERPTIIWLGPIAHRKGILPFIHALHMVRKYVPNVLAKIAGTGETFEEMTALIEAYDLHAQVEIMGSIPRAEVPAYLASGHLLCQASVGEPYGMSIVEAMALGRPIVATAAGGFLDTVDPEGGLLVPVNDPKALAEALTRVLTDAPLAASMSAYNAKKAQRYAWPRIIDRIERLYGSVIS